MEEPQVYRLYLQPGLKLMLVLGFVAFTGIAVAFSLAPSLIQSTKVPPPMVGVIFLVILVFYLIWVLSLPYRITFAGDGTIEFIGVLRRRTVRAEEISSIKPEGSQVGFFMVRTDRGKIRILAQFDGFHDFLTRLKAMHPAVELRGC
ncbi:MAG: hypothetical protein M1438_01230 [Deltaproteobacteria bacterium]|nr:hypothetical protein [Deltaproteobacteria bacterium]